MSRKESRAGGPSSEDSQALSAAAKRHRLGIIALLGVVSGLPFLLTGSTLTTRLRVEHVGVATIGYFAWAHMPYTLKVFWAPLLDRIRLPFLGRRRGWMAVFQVALFLGILLLGATRPSDNLRVLFVIACMVCFFSASLDIVVDAYRTEVLEERERGPGGAVYVTGYRAALVIGGAGVLVASDFMPWSVAYYCLAGLMLATLLVTFAAERSPEVEGSPKTLREAALGPFRDLKSRQFGLAVLVFLLLYKVGEGIAGHLIHPFLIDVGFSASAVGAINKGVGLPAAIAGTLLGGVAVTSFGVRRSLLVFGLFQGAPNLLYALQSVRGADHVLLAVVVSVDQFCNGLATAALVVYLMSLCDRRFTAFQYAFLSSATSILGRFVSGWSGVLQEEVGWPWFFAFTALAGLPALIALALLPTDAGLPAVPAPAKAK